MSLDVSSIMGSSNVSDVYQNYSTQSMGNISDSFQNVVSGLEEPQEGAFDSIFQSALSLVNETNEYSNMAEEEELNYAMGLSEDTHTLMIAQQKANVSLMYTVAVRDAVIDAYNEIMNMQF